MGEGRLRRVVVTGANGFLGGHLVRAARAEGKSVLGVVREAAAGQASMASILADPDLLNGTDVLVHAAAIRHRHDATPASYQASNVDLVDALVRAAAGRVGRFVHVSSVGVYGFPTDLPITEATPFRPRTLYSQTKIEAEKLVTSLATKLALPFTIIRPTIIYGPGDTNGMLDKLAAMLRARRYLLVGSGANTLHHTYVDDVVRGIYTLADSAKTAGDHFILAGPETITLRALSELVARHVGTKVPRVHVPLRLARGVAACFDVARYQKLAFVDREPPINNEKLDVMTVSVAFDPAKAKAVGYAPRVRYEEGLALTLGAGRA